MTEEEKQGRADNCTEEKFNQLVDELLEKAVELYSIASRVFASTLKGFATYEDGQHVWAKVRTAETYVDSLNLMIQGAKH